MAKLSSHYRVNNRYHKQVLVSILTNKIWVEPRHESSHEGMITCFFIYYQP